MIPLRTLICLTIALGLLPSCDSGRHDQAGEPTPYMITPNTSPAPLPVVSKPAWDPITISTEDLNTRLAAREDLPVYDVRSETAFEKEHIKGAASLPWADIDKRKGTLRKDKPIVLYCA